MGRHAAGLTKRAEDYDELQPTRRRALTKKRARQAEVKIGKRNRTRRVEDNGGTQLHDVSRADGKSIVLGQQHSTAARTIHNTTPHTILYL